MERLGDFGTRTMDIDALRGGVTPKSHASLGAVCHALAIDPVLCFISVVPRTRLAAGGGSVHSECETKGL